MKKLSDLKKGAKARKRIDLEIRGDKYSVDIRVLTPMQEIEAKAAAIAFAKERGVTDPDFGNDIYDLAFAAHIALVACIDPESPVDAPKQQFSDLDDVLSGDLETDHILAIAAMWKKFQQESGGSLEAMSVEATEKAIIALADDNEAAAALFFFRMLPGTQLSLARFMASRLLTLLLDNSNSTSLSSN